MPTLPNIGDTLKDLVWDAIVAQVVQLAFKAAPFLKWGPLAGLTTLVVEWVADKVYEIGKEVFDMQKIAFTNTAHLREYELSSLKLKILARDKGIDSPEFQEARDATRKALSTFVQFAPRPK